MSNNPYDHGLDKCVAKHVPLSPLSFLERTAQIHPGRPSGIRRARRSSRAEARAHSHFHSDCRCHRMACALTSRGDTVAVMPSLVVDDIVAPCRADLPRLKVPRHAALRVLPRASTRKFQKFVLRQQAKSSSAIE